MSVAENSPRPARPPAGRSLRPRARTTSAGGRHEEKTHHRGTENQIKLSPRRHKDTKNFLITRFARKISLCSFVSLCLRGDSFWFSRTSVVNLFFPPIAASATTSLVSHLRELAPDAFNFTYYCKAIPLGVGIAEEVIQWRLAAIHAAEVVVFGSSTVRTPYDPTTKPRGERRFITA